VWARANRDYKFNRWSSSDGDTVKITLDSDTALKKEVVEAIAGRDIIVEITVGNVTWVIDGKHVPKIFITRPRMRWSSGTPR
jgi:hypothetical protein